MEARSYYNEIDPYCAQWLRNLILCGEIADGDVDTRSIADVRPDDLDSYTQCHFFAGLGGWSLALRLAGWPDSRSVWTGSCPCQPFSQAGAQRGFADERHLWPVWRELITKRRPPVVFGEQVASPLARAWLAAVRADMEGAAYAVGAGDICAAGAGAPHIRQRIYWVADANGRDTSAEGVQRSGQHRQQQEDGRTVDGLADDESQRQERRHGEQGDALRRAGQGTGVERHGAIGELGDSGGGGSGRDTGAISGAQGEGGSGGPSARREPHLVEPAGAASGLGHHHHHHHHHTGLEGRSLSAGGRSGERTPWTPSDFVWCRDGKWRPVEPGSFPLAHGAPARVGRLRAYGNAIVAPLTAEFIGAYRDV